MFDTQSRLNLEETLSYERFLLKDCARHILEAEGIVHPFILVRNDAPPHEMRISLSEDLASTHIAGFVKQMSPLLFCGAYKLLDMVVEWIIHENTGERPWQFKEKIKKLETTRMTFPDFLETDIALREALLALYIELVEYRNAITHGKWGENQEGNLRFDFSKNNQSFQRSVSAAQVMALGDLMSRIGNYLVIPSTQTDVEILHLKVILDRLASLHGKPAFNVELPRYYRVVRKTRLSTQPFRVDIGSIRADLDPQASGHPYRFSLRIEADTATGKLFWEIPADQVPVVDFDLDSQWDTYLVQQ